MADTGVAYGRSFEGISLLFLACASYGLKATTHDLRFHNR